MRNNIACPSSAAATQHVYFTIIMCPMGLVKSTSFSIYNVVRQGVIMGPVLFCIRLDELLNHLANAKICCHIGYIYAGSLAYADDVTLLVTTAGAIRKKR